MSSFNDGDLDGFYVAKAHASLAQFLKRYVFVIGLYCETARQRDTDMGRGYIKTVTAYPCIVKKERVAATQHEQVYVSQFVLTVCRPAFTNQKWSA